MGVQRKDYREGKLEGRLRTDYGGLLILLFYKKFGGYAVGNKES